MVAGRLFSLLVVGVPCLLSQGCATQALWGKFDDVTRDRCQVEAEIAAERVTRAARTGEGVYVMEVAYRNGERRSYTWTPPLPAGERPQMNGRQCEPEDRAPPALTASSQAFPDRCPEGWVPVDVVQGEDWPEQPAPGPIDLRAEPPKEPWPGLRMSREGLLEHREGHEGWEAVARVPALSESHEQEEGVDAGDVALGAVWVGLTPMTVAVDAVTVGLVVGFIGVLIPLALF